MEHTRRKTGALALAAVVALVLAGCAEDSEGGSSDGGLTGDPYTIGYLSSENDPAASFPEGRIAAEAAVSYINEELGGLDGHPLKLETCIVTSAPEPSQACANEMVTKNVNAVINPYNYSEVVEYPIFAAAGIPTFGGGVGSGSSSGYSAPTNVAWHAGSPMLNAAVGTFALENLGAKKIVNVHLDVSAFDVTNQGLKKGVEAGGGELELVGAAPTTSDWIPPLQAALDKNPDVIVVYQAQAGCTGLMKAYQQLDADVPVVTTSLCGDASVLSAAGEGAEGWYFTSAGPWPAEDSEDPDVQTFVQALKDHAGAGEINTSGAAPLAWMNVMTLYTNVLKPLGYDGASKDKLVDQAHSITEGTAVLGPPLFECGKYKTLPSACGGEGQHVYQYTDGKFVAADDGEWVGTDLAAYGG